MRMNLSSFNFRNPSRPWRIFFVACFFAAPGCLAGALLSLGLGRPVFLLLLGTMLGALSGALIEGWK